MRDNRVIQVSVTVNEDGFFDSHDSNVLLYNRIPKTGSSSMLRMLRALELQNFKFQSVGIYKQNIQSLQRHLNTSQQMEYVKKTEREKRKHFPEPIFVNNHVHYIDFTDHGIPKQPVYFNTVRDPYDRFKSRYYWHRKDFQAKGWFKNYHLIEPDADPRDRDYWDWKNKTFEECVMDFSDKECHIENGSMRDYSIPYFCGQELECTRHNSPWALRQAIENVELHYPVVGVLEEMDDSLMVMQSVLPNFFDGIHDRFGGDEALHKNKQSYSEDSSAQEMEDYYQEVESIIKDQLITEYEFYNYIKQRLASQAKTISLR